MADIFISYAREDRAIAERLASAIEAADMSVWWDRHIKGGAQFSKDIERELNAATHVLVLWSEASIESRWVRDEATEAADDARLIGATIDGTMPPLGFRQFHTVDLQEWTRTGAALPEELAEVFGTEASPPPTSAPPLEPPKSKRPLLIAGAAALAVAVAGGAYVVTDGFSDSGQQATRDAATLAILPFTGSGDEEAADLAAGMAGALNASLSGFASLSMTSPSSVAQLARQDLSTQEIGNQLNVGHLVEGSLRIENETAHLTMALIDASNARQIWTQRMSRPRAEFALLTENMTRQLSAVLQSRLGVGQGSLASAASVDPEAYEAYLRGTEMIHARGVGDNRRDAYTELRRAVRLDPDFAPAHAALAYIVALSSNEYLSLTNEEARALVKRSTGRALELDPGNVLAKVANIHVTENLGGDVIAAFSSAQQLVEDHPNFPLGHYAMASIHAFIGDHRRATPHYRLALQADPLNSLYRLQLLRSLVSLNDYDGLREEAMSCEKCTVETNFWIEGIIYLADREEFERDWPLVESRALALGYKQTDLDQFLEVISALKQGRPFPAGQENWLSDHVFGANELAAFGQFGDGLGRLAYKDDYLSGTQIQDFLDNPVVEWPEAARADPRYHALFEIPSAKSLLEARRELGRTRNLPVFPVKPYEGP